MFNMREIYDPVYYPPVIQGFDEYSRQYSQYARPSQPPQYQPPPPVSKSPSGSSVLGKFLKLGKSKSDVGSVAGLSPSSAGFTSPVGSIRGSSASGAATGCEVDDFRLSPSVISWGPVQKMVHNKANKRDVSRSHSWIYGSVKLAGDLPFGYADNFMPSGSDRDHPENQQGHYAHPQSHYLHTHSLQAMQIPRCHVDPYASSSCTCPHSSSPGELPPEWGSVRNARPRGSRPEECQGCAREMAMKYALPSKNAGRGSLGGNSGESFVSSVRKLTWKSLKQVVKKRPSLDTLRKTPQTPSEYLSAPIVPMPYLSPSAVAAATATSPDSPNMNPLANPQSHYGHPNVPQHHQPGPGPDYFFPDKKQFYASCNDIYSSNEKGQLSRGGPPSPPNGVTASVRVRPKRTRQPWQLSQETQASEFGPVPNYEEDGAEGNPQGLYHSEWDLRNVMSYDMWMNATSNVKPRTSSQQPIPSSGNSSISSRRSHSAEARHYHSSGALHVPPPDYGKPVEAPTTFKPKSGANSSKNSGGKGSVSSSKSLTSLHSPLPAASSSGRNSSLSSSHSSDTLKISSYSPGSSSSSKTKCAPGTGSPGSAIVKRGSILAADVTAYQLIKQQTKKNGATPSQASPSQSSVKSAASVATSKNATPVARNPGILKNKHQPSPQAKPPPVEIEDAFSESSDDLSDNAISGPSAAERPESARSNGTANSSNGSGLGVRIAGQGIRMVPNKKGGNTTTIVVPPKTSPPNSSNTKASSKQVVTSSKRLPSSSESESDRWSDCHTEPRRRNTNSGGGSSTSNSSAMNNNKSANFTPQPQKTASVKVTGSQQRRSLVTFEKGPPPPPQLPPNATSSIKSTSKSPSASSFSTAASRKESDMEFEEYEIDCGRQKTLDPSRHVVSLNVPSSSSQPPSSSKPQYVKHTKSSNLSNASSQPLSSTTSTSSSKFGALRRRKRGGSNVATSPGKLLQETIFEESDPDSQENHNQSPPIPPRGQSPHHLQNNSKHAVKITIGGGSSSSSSPPQPTQSTVKPILKNHQRNNPSNYETPVGISTNAANNANSCSSTSDAVNAANHTWQNQDCSPSTSTFEDSNQQDSQQIYFDSSVSTTSTKKKVQFDHSKMVVHGESSSSSGSDAGSDGGDAYDYENDDSDQWSNKSEEEEEEPSPPQQMVPPQNKPATAVQTQPTSNSSPIPKPKSLFEEEVARKAAALQKSRDAKLLAQQQNVPKVNNPPSVNLPTIVQQSKAIVNGNSKNNVTSTASSPQKENRVNNEVTRPPPPKINQSGSNNNRTTVNNEPVKLSTFNQQNGNSGNTTQLVINPNSLLFHDTTRIRLNQSRPCLQENTFRLPNGNGDSSNKSGGGSPSTGAGRRLKQSNSFRSVVSSVALRPREPPPPPPKFTPNAHVNVASRTSLSSVPARLQKALSTSTLLSKSTEKLNISGGGSVSAKSGGGSHYGPGGRLLPSKSQISLPLGCKTTSKTAAGLLATSTSTQDIPSSVATSRKLTCNAHLSKSSTSLASRSKSLSSRCQALEKVLREQKAHQEEELPTKLHSAPSMPALHLSSAHDMDSKNIEIVTKENSVSEIRIYSASNASSSTNPSNPTYDENLPYQGIIYESTKTMITTTSNSNTPPSPPKSSQPPPRPPPPEIHYAATDLFSSPAPTPPPKTPTPKSSPPTTAPSTFNHPPLPPIPSKEEDYQLTGKSVVLIIDNSKKSASTALTNYSQPLDSLPRSSNPPRSPSPIEEPLYDDVISHSIPPPTTKPLPLSLGDLPPLPPPPVPPHRTPPITPKEVVSSTLPCLACPPSLPPPNLPSKSLSEFQKRPLVIQENEDFLEMEVDNLYNDITTPSNTLKASTASQFATAMKSAFLGALGGGNKRNSGDFSDQRSIHSVTSTGSGNTSTSPCKKSPLIYDDTLSISSSGASSSTSGSLNKKNLPAAQQLVPLPLPPPSVKSVEETVMELLTEEEPLYDDVLNLSSGEKAEVSSVNKSNKDAGSVVSGNGGNEYHSSNSSDSGTEDLPPPLPAQGPPSLSKDTLLVFPIIPSNVVPSSKEETTSNKSSGGSLRGGGIVKTGNRTLLSELNEKLQNLNHVSSSVKEQERSRDSPGGASDASSGEFNGSEEGFHISKVVISPPSSESSGVEEDYNSEKNYSLRSLEGSTGSGRSSNGSTSSRAGSDNEGNTYGSKNNAKAGNNSGGDKEMPSQAISMARGKFLENMKLSMLGGGPSVSSGGKTPVPGVDAGPKAMLITGQTVGSKLVNEEEDEEEPIYEEIGENLQQMKMQVTSRIIKPEVEKNDTAAATEDDPDLEDLEARSASPVYADAFDAKSMFDGASRSEILSFLESIRDRLTGAESTSSSESQSSSISRSSSSATTTAEKKEEIEKRIETLEETVENTEDADDNETLAVIPEDSGKSEEKERLLCYDCNDDIEEGDETVTSAELNNNSKQEVVASGEDVSVTTGLAHPGRDEKHNNGAKCCKSCNRKRNEKKEIIMEIYETELKYGRDLKIVNEEFYKPIQVAGLLTKEQLDQIFLNVEQLIKINHELTGRLKQEIQRSQLHRKSVGENGNKKEDELSEVNVGKIFLELGESMMTAFENYCTRQASAGALLSQLEKEKELLRIFLRVSQMENTVLRRMNLPAFLMVPVQRVTRYPLLLSRLLKVTPVDHFTREELQSAQEKIEQHLEHMNKTTREVASVKLWRRISIINGNSSSSGPSGAHRRSNSDLDASNIRIRKMALDVLDWTSLNDVTCVLDNQLGSVHFNGKLTRNIYGCLLVRGKDLEQLASKIQDQDPFFPPAAEDVVKDVKLVLVRVKNTRFCLLREPLCLSKCVVSQGENEFQEFIEINEITTKNTYFIQGLDRQGTATWLRFLQCYSSCVGHWRRRRPALANIMMNGMIKHL